ncbi:MAG TPA: hypothetical protein VGJ63_01230 [Micromonosporaceae bacterium]|jgi:uncharacterized membrane protein
MFAIIAAIIFGFALLLDLFDTNLGASDAFNSTTLMIAGLLFLALHFAGVGSWRGYRGYRGRRPGPG